ncbi:MAG: branched-chain amino acid ABC transporter permease [Fimbriimonadaceae bacterium]|nr:branched-chain amino acid ABC transporter permease [Fimbriimonadaceae bacterium]
MKIWVVRILSIIGTLVAVFGFEFFMRGLVAQDQSLDYIYRLAVLAGLFVTLAVSLNLINGITGQFSIGHASFYMVGAYAGATLTNSLYKIQPLGPETWLFVVALGGAVAAGIAGLIVGLHSLRLKGDYLAIVTLGFGEIIRIIVFNQPFLGGSFGLNIADKNDKSLWAVLLLAILCIAVCRNLCQTPHGLAFLAVREDEVASSAMGVNVTRVKVTAFIVGSAFAGAAGALLGVYDGLITPDTFRMDVSFLILTMVVLGGTGSITGSVIAALLLFSIPEWPRFMVEGGKPWQVTGATLLAGAICLIVSVYLVKRTIDEYHGPQRTKTLRIVGIVGGGIIGTVLLGTVFGLIPVLANRTWDVGALRMVFLAVTLIVLMLIRPQGIFGHEEFGWQKAMKALRFGKPGANPT